MIIKLIFVCIILTYFIEDFTAIRWLSLQHSTQLWNATAATPRPCRTARRRLGLSPSQTRQCRANREVMSHVQRAARLASETCQGVFQHRRWNCSSVDLAPYLTPDLTRATREQAYVYAISSAALTYTMARACTTGTLHQCTCALRPDGIPKGDFHWGGCGDNLKWGIRFARKFTDSTEKQAIKKNVKGIKRSETDLEKRARMVWKEIAGVNLHNNKVGRKVISESLQIQCKCHGVSGSCNIKTCWKALAPINEIGLKLLKKYTNAKEVGKSFIYEENRMISNSTVKKYPYNELVYLFKSPDYCTKDDTLGSFGTIGRKCNVTSSGTDGCRQLCCGRGYRTVVEEKIERCQCKYYYCCYVKCKICRTMTQIHECS